jgi:hypothetical protein
MTLIREFSLRQNLNSPNPDRSLVNSIIAKYMCNLLQGSYKLQKGDLAIVLASKQGKEI